MLASTAVPCAAGSPVPVARLPNGLLHAVRPRPAVLLGGPGWDLDGVPPATTWLADLPGAVDTVVALSGGTVAAGGAR